LLLESLQSFSIRLGDKTHLLPPAVLVTRLPQLSVMWTLLMQ